MRSMFTERTIRSNDGILKSFENRNMGRYTSHSVCYGETPTDMIYNMSSK